MPKVESQELSEALNAPLSCPWDCHWATSSPWEPQKGMADRTREETGGSILTNFLPPSSLGYLKGVSLVGMSDNSVSNGNGEGNC